MSKFFHLCKKTSQKSARRKFSMKISLKVCNFVIAVAILACGLGYIIQANSLATKGYLIKELEKDIASLKQENADLQLQALSLQSTEAINEKVAKLGMVAADNADYLLPTPVAVAR